MILEAACRSSEPPYQIIPSALAYLETDRGNPFLRGEEGRVLSFRSAGYVERRPPLHGQASRAVAELIDVSGMARHKMQSCFFSVGPEFDEAEVTQVNPKWAMGFSWSVYAAQSVMLGCSLRAGVTNIQFLAHDAQVPDDMIDFISVATDDVMRLSNERPCQSYE